MKKMYTLLFLTASFFSVANAQSNPDLSFKKGDKLLGGSLSFTNSNNSSFNNYSQKGTGFSIAPAIGFFTRPNQLTGIALQYNYFNTKINNPIQEIKNNSFGVNVYKQYWNRLAKNFYFNIEGRAGLSYNYSDYSSNMGNGSKVKNYGVNFSIQPGFAYRIKKRLVLDLYYTNFLSAGYSYSKTKYSNAAEANGHDIAFNTGLQNFSMDNFRFGFRYVL